MPAENLAAWLAELHRRLKAGGLARHAPVALNRAETIVDVERGVRTLPEQFLKLLRQHHLDRLELLPIEPRLLHAVPLAGRQQAHRVQLVPGRERRVDPGQAGNSRGEALGTAGGGHRAIIARARRRPRGAIDDPP